MLRKISTYIAENNLLKPTDKVLVAVSGGIDSVVLLHALLTLKYECIVVHCNFHLRGEESDRDETFVQQLAEKYNCRFIKTDFDTTKFAEENHLSIEMAARELRYEWFEDVRKKESCQCVAVAHHANDSIETFFLNLIRGTGINGLTGIKPRNNFVVRPMLSCFRNEIENYAQQHQLSSCFDSTNNDVKFKRNAIRHQIIPQFEKLNPSFQGTMSDNFERIANIQEISLFFINSLFNSLITNDLENTIIDTKKLSKTPVYYQILSEILHKYGFSNDNIKKIFQQIETNSGKKFYSSEFELLINRKEIIIKKKSNEEEKKIFLISEIQDLYYPIQIKFEKKSRENFDLKRSKNFANLDAEKIRFPLTLRKWKQGDVFFPFGMNQKKKLSDFFIDQKMSLFEKENIWILTSANDEIIWVIGERIDNRFSITDETKKVLLIQKL